MRGVYELGFIYVIGMVTGMGMPMPLFIYGLKMQYIMGIRIGSYKHGPRYGISIWACPWCQNFTVSKFHQLLFVLLMVPLTLSLVNIYP